MRKYFEFPIEQKKNGENYKIMQALERISFLVGHPVFFESCSTSWVFMMFGSGIHSLRRFEYRFCQEQMKFCLDIIPNQICLSVFHLQRVDVNGPF